MKITLLSIADGKWGGARAAYRLHEGLRAIHADSQMVVQSKFTDDPTVSGLPQKLGRAIAKVRATIDGLPLLAYPQRQQGDFSCQWLPNRLTSQIARHSPDILNLHWACAAYLPIETLARLPYPLVWTLHDLWAMTGGCHNPHTCTHYRQACGHCPQLGSNQAQDLSHWVWQRKQKAWGKLPLTLVTPSRWLADCARSSSLFRHHRIEVIANGLDLETYQPSPKALAREQLGLPADSKLVMFGALKATSDPNKGFDLLAAALQQLSQTAWADQLEVVIFGEPEPANPPKLGLPIHYLGYLQNEQVLATAYAAADVMIVPSRQEAFGQTASEALACGTPVAAFGSSGLLDVVYHLRDGYLAAPYDIQDLAYGIDWVLTDAQRYQQLSNAAAAKAKAEFGLERQAKRYHKLFAEILGQG